MIVKGAKNVEFGSIVKFILQMPLNPLGFIEGSGSSECARFCCVTQLFVHLYINFVPFLNVRKASGNKYRKFELIYTMSKT